MAEFYDDDDLKRWVRVWNRGHGYAGVFNSENQNDKQTVELDTITDWCASAAAEYGLEVNELRQNLDDPPDFIASVARPDQKIELVQLVEEEHKHRAAKGENPHHGKLFEDAQWSKDRFERKLNDVIVKKGERYKKKGLKIDMLIVHTAEPFLTSNQAQEWLEEINIEPHPNIDNVSLIFEYEPGREMDHWPVVSVYGDLFPKANKR